MQTLHFSIIINAPVEKVWDTMLGDATYRKWTEVFNPGSYYKGSWDKGSEIRFLGPNPETGKEGGMISRIAENRTHEFVSIEHIGMVEDGVDDTTSEKVKAWLPAYENYTFVSKDGGTEVKVDLDTVDEYADMFNDMWPKSLESLKKLCES